MNKRIFFISLSIMTFFVIIFSISYILPFKAEGELLTLNGPWSIDTKGIHMEDATVDEVSEVLRNLHERDVVTLTYNLEDNVDMIIPTILLRTNYSAVEVLGGELRLYSKWMSQYEEHRFIGGCYHFIPIPDKIMDNKLKIKLFISEDEAYGYFEPPIIGSYHDIQKSYIRDRLFSTSCACFLVVFGICFIFITLLFYSAVPNILSQLFSSILFLDFGIWMGGYFGITQLFMNSTYLSTVELVALYLLVPISTLIFGTIGRHYKNTVYTAVSTILTVITLLLIALHFMNIVHMNRTLAIYYLICFITFFMILKEMIGDMKKNELPKTAMTQEMGFFIFGVSITLHLAFRILDENQIISTNDVIETIPSVGVMMYIYVYLLNYFIYITEMYAQRQENVSLTRLAYADGLTNLPNRSMWSKRMKELKNSDSDYCIISLDLNGLKEVNDRLGHTFGDAYIDGFAKNMVETFPKDAFMARIGGDEFVVVLEKEKPIETESYIYEITEKLSAQNVNDDSFKRSVAAGYAYKSELNEEDRSDPQNVYLLADKRMYDVKRHMHNSQRIGEREGLF